MQEQLKAKGAQLQMKDKMLEETKVEHLIEVKSYEERLNNVMLEYDNYKNSHPEKHTGTAEIMEVDDDQYYSNENNLWKDKCELTSCMNEMKAEREDCCIFAIGTRQISGNHETAI